MEIGANEDYTPFGKSILAIILDGGYLPEIVCLENTNVRKTINQERGRSLRFPYSLHIINPCLLSSFSLLEPFLYRFLMYNFLYLNTTYEDE